MYEEQPEYAPWGTVSPQFWQAGQPSAPAAAPSSRLMKAPAAAEGQVAYAGDQGVPAEYRNQVERITAAFRTRDGARLAAAAIEAEQLDQEFTARYGQQHPHTINLRELRGWLAHQQGQASVAARWYLHTTGLQALVWGSGHDITQASAKRAVHIWLAIEDPQESLAVGRELQAMLTAVAGEDSGILHQVRRRMTARERLATR